MSDSVHPAAARGFGATADEYERARPEYSTEAVDRLVQELEIGRRCTVLDLGAGTGKLTRQLVPTGARLVALEPIEAMRHQLSEVVPGVEVVAGTAEETPLRDETFDAVVAGQAFHWFDGDRALPEIHRVLRRHGRLGLLWNVRDESVPWVRELTRIIKPHEGNAPREYRHEWQAAFSRNGQFGTLHRLRFAHQQRLDADGLIQRVASMSFIAVLPPADRERVFAQVRHLTASDPELAGEFALPYRTDLYWCVRS